MFHHRRTVAAVAATAAVAVITPAPASASAQTTLELVSRRSDGSASPAGSSISGSAPVTSADGRYVVFTSEAGLVARDDNGIEDVYLRDTTTGRTTLVSQARGRVGNDYSSEATISADGSRIAYTTWATNLFDDRNGSTLDVVVKDLDTGRLQVVSADSDGRQRKVDSFTPVISGNGAVVAFQTFGRYTADDTDRTEDVYVHRIANSTTRKVSYRPDGRDVTVPHLVGNVSYDGNRIAFGWSSRLYVRDVQKRATLLAWKEKDGGVLGEPGGSAGRPAISGNGRYVAFTTAARTADGLSHVFRRDLRTGDLVRVDRGADDDARLPSLSYDGAVVAFSSFAGNLGEGDLERGDSEVFVTDLPTGETTWISPSKENPTDESGRWGVVVSQDGSTVAYESYDDLLVAGDSNGVADVFLWRR